MLRRFKELLSRKFRQDSRAAMAKAAAACKEQGDKHAAESRLKEAEQCYRRALAIDPALAEVHNNLGIVLDRAERFGEAIACYLQALAIKPDHATACLNIGNWHRLHGNREEQVRYLEKAVALKPDYHEAHNNLGSAFYSEGKFDEAISCFEKALSIRPDFAQAHLNLGICHRAKKNSHEEIAHIEKAITLQPDFHEAHNQLGFTWQTRAEFKKAEECHRIALAIAPNSPSCKLNLSHALMQQGNYEEGLELFEARFAAYKIQIEDYDDTYFDVASKAPPWTGGDLRGKTLLLWMEQGFGDNLMMLRYLPELLHKGAARLVVACRPELARIVRQLPCAPEVVVTEKEVRGNTYDFHCPLTSLPYLLRTRLDTIPAPIPYLSVPEEMKRHWADRLAGQPGRKVGLVWAGNKRMPRDDLRSMPLETLAPLRAIPGLVFVSLQKGGAQDVREGIDWPRRDWIDECEDFLDTAALVENLDLIIGVDTSTIHLAGALGRPVWLLNRFESEWRWMTGRTDSPWYPTLRIFRQPALYDWHGLVTEIAAELQTWVAAKASHSMEYPRNTDSLPSA